MKKILLVLGCLFTLTGCVETNALAEEEIVITVKDDDVKWMQPQKQDLKLLSKDCDVTDFLSILDN